VRVARFAAAPPAAGFDAEFLAPADDEPARVVVFFRALEPPVALDVFFFDDGRARVAALIRVEGFFFAALCFLAVVGRFGADVFADVFFFFAAVADGRALEAERVACDERAAVFFFFFFVVAAGRARVLAVEVFFATDGLRDGARTHPSGLGRTGAFAPKASKRRASVPIHPGPVN